MVKYFDWLKFFPVVKRAILQAKVWLRTVDVKPALSEGAPYECEIHLLSPGCTRVQACGLALNRGPIYFDIVEEKNDFKNLQWINGKGKFWLP